MVDLFDGAGAGAGPPPPAAADLPAELERAAPEAAEDLTGGDLSGGTGFAQGVGNILDRLADQVGDVVRERTRGAAAVLLVVVLCGVVEGFAQGTGGKGRRSCPWRGRCPSPWPPPGAWTP